MKRSLLLVFIVFCCVIPVEARMNVATVGAGVPAAGATTCDCSGTISFCWPAESLTVTSGTPAGCVDSGDVLGSANSSAVIDTDGTPVPYNGTGCLSIPTSNDYITFDVSSEDHIASEAGRVSFWVYGPVAGTLVYFVIAYIDADNYIAVLLDSGSEAILRYRSVGTNYQVSTVATMAEATWTKVVASWSVAPVSGNTLRIGIVETDTDPTFVTDTDALVDMGSAALALTFGDRTNSGGGGGYFYDDIKIYKEW